jgi:endonuclease G, mitochondrial
MYFHDALASNQGPIEGEEAMKIRHGHKRLATAGLAGAMLTAVPCAAQSDMLDKSELHSFHCLYGCPIGAPAANDIAVREIYTLSSNDLTRMADWVAYRITTETIAKSKGTRQWQPDPWLAADETLKPTDYDDASAALHIDRGHQAPLAAFSGSPNWADTNFLSNITPQGSALNEGSWQWLEAREPHWSSAAPSRSTCSPALCTNG